MTGVDGVSVLLLHDRGIEMLTVRRRIPAVPFGALLVGAFDATASQPAPARNKGKGSGGGTKGD